jgi:hypothetical protein
VTEPELMECEGAKAFVYRDAPSWEGAQTAAVGRFSCQTAESGRALLEQTVGRLRVEGFGATIGPMDGDTWHSYRLVWESDGSPPFAMEPTSGPHDKQAFLASGFAPISEYVSARALLADAVGEPAPAVPGVTIATWDGQNAARLVESMFEMSLAAFARNRFFKPIGHDAFLELYRPVMPLVDPRLVLFAYDSNGRLVGFLFGLPDRLQGASPTTAILKTYASRAHGVGRMLADHFHRRALDLGFREVVHALMQVDNASLARSGMHEARIFRRYALVGARL